MSSDRPQGAGIFPKLLAAAWRPAAVWYFGLALAGLAIGFWPGAVFFPRTLPGAPLPALSSLAVAQVAFFLLLYPLILARRARGADRYWLSCALESAALLATTAPLYVAAAWVSDATGADCLRAALAVACFCPLSWAGGRHLRDRHWTSAVLICLWGAALGLPWAQYVCNDFTAGTKAASALWQAAPATFAWDAASARQPFWWPAPAWCIVLWLAVGAGLAAIPSGRVLCPSPSAGKSMGNSNMPFREDA